MMPRHAIIEKDFYQFDELDDCAKERARDWYRGCMDSSDFKFVIDDFVTIANIIGIEFETHEVRLMSGKTRRDPNIWWSVSYCQGDGACFEGTYRQNGDSCVKIREHCDDAELLGVTDELARIQAARILLHRQPLTAKIERGSSNYCHEHAVDISVYGEEDDWEDISDAEDQAVKELMRDLMRWLHHALQREDEWLNSDECVDENIRANAYEFDEEGEIA